jgi:predicted RNA methylase
LKLRKWLDLGGHIGAFAAFAIGSGAKEVLSFEPHPDNATYFRRNVAWHILVLVGSVLHVEFVSVTFDSAN